MLTGPARIAVPRRTIDAFVRSSAHSRSCQRQHGPARVEVKHVGDAQHHVVSLGAESVPYVGNAVADRSMGGQAAVTTLAQVVDQRPRPGADVDDRVGHVDARRAERYPFGGVNGPGS